MSNRHTLFHSRTNAQCVLLTIFRPCVSRWGRRPASQRASRDVNNFQWVLWIFGDSMHYPAAFNQLALTFHLLALPFLSFCMVGLRCVSTAGAVSGIQIVFWGSFSPLTTFWMPLTPYSSSTLDGGVSWTQGEMIYIKGSAFRPYNGNGHKT